MTRVKLNTRFALALLLTVALTPWVSANEGDVKTVSLESLSSLSTRQVRSFPATVVTENTTNISAKINAEVSSLPFLVGETVKQGEIVATLDCELYVLEAEAAKAALDLAAEDLGRIKALRKKSVVSAQQLTAASVKQRQASVQHRQAKLRIKYCNVTAPFSGVITKRMSSVGDYAAPGAPLVELVQNDSIEVKALLPVDIAQSLGSKASLHFTQSDQQYPLVLRTVVPIIDQATKTQEVRLLVDAKIPPGSFGRLTWQSAEKLLPADLLQTRGGKFGIFIESDGRAQFHELPTAVVGKPATVNLPENTPVITTGRHSLEDGQRIKVR